MPLTFYPEGAQVLPSDDSNRTLHKIAALSGGSSGGGSGTGSQEIFYDLNPAAPPDPTKPAISLNTTTQVASYWTGAAWV